MSDPFHIEGPAIVSFSGGRSSALLLWHILQSHGGALPDDVHVLFANTGKEMPQTLDFVQACSEQWAVPVTWIEYQSAPEARDRWRVVDHASASREGEPFAAVIGERNYLPNPVARFCTGELKVKAMHRYLHATHGWREWDTVVGIRADEPRRVARLAVSNGNGQDVGARIAPLASAGLGAQDVSAFWSAQAFDLRLPNMNGRTMHGNCDLCFLKGAKQIASLIAEEPRRADWWAAQEARLLGVATTTAAAFFRSDRPSYAALKYVALHQLSLEGFDPIEDCFCTD